MLVALVNVSMTRTARVWRTLTLPSSAVARGSTRSGGRSGFNVVWPSETSGLMHVIMTPKPRNRCADVLGWQPREWSVVREKGGEIKEGLRMSERGQLRRREQQLHQRKHRTRRREIAHERKKRGKTLDSDQMLPFLYERGQLKYILSP